MPVGHLFVFFKEVSTQDLCFFNWNFLLLYRSVQAFQFLHILPRLRLQLVFAWADDVSLVFPSVEGVSFHPPTFAIESSRFPFPDWKWPLDPRNLSVQVIWERTRKGSLQKVDKSPLLVSTSLKKLFLKTGRGGSKVRDIQSTTNTKIQVSGLCS